MAFQSLWPWLWFLKATGHGFKPHCLDFWLAALSHIVWGLASLFKGHLIFHDVVFTANIKRELNDLEDDFDDEKTYMEMVDEAEWFSWDQLVEDDEDDDSADDGLVMELD
jgi:hypothetical protein